MRAVLDASAFLDDALYGRSYNVVIIETWRRLNVTRHGIPRLLPRIWEPRHAITASDASYVALAEALDIPLVTTDLRLARAAERYCDVAIPD